MAAHHPAQLPYGPDRSDAEAGPHPVPFNRKWRNIWTDGRANPKVDDFLEPRWWGYSVGRWTDDYTFVAETVGLDERTWLDNVGRPHSLEARIENATSVGTPSTST